MANGTGIKVSDIALLESQRMTDDPDAGGPPTSRHIEDSEKNNIFPDVSRLDRAYGRVSMRKIYGGVETNSTETYHGVHAIVGDRPQDDNVQILLFDTGGELYDERRDARDHVEAYLIPDRIRRYQIFGRHLAGMTSLQISAPTTETQPTIGETLAVEHQDGSADYIRVAGTTSSIDQHEYETTNDQGEPVVERFSRRTINISTSRPLPRDYDGAEPQPTWSDHASPYQFRSMRVADAARYFGATEAATDIAPGDSFINLRDLYAQIVPTTQREEVVSDQAALQDLVMEVQAGGETLEVPTHVHTFFLGVSQASRGFSWTAYLRPLPEPGTLSIYWQGLGNWELIKDEAGDGSLTGRGSGTVNYENGAIVFTTLEMPDAPSEIMLQWGSEAQYRDRSNRTVSTGNNPPQMVFSAGEPIHPGSLSIKYLAGDVMQEVTDDSAGNLVGPATGRVIYSSGDIGIVPDTYADPSTKLRVEYLKSMRRTEIIDPADPPQGAQIPAGARPGDGIKGADGRLMVPETGAASTSGDDDTGKGKGGGYGTAGTYLEATIHKGPLVPTIGYTVEHPPIKPRTLNLRWTIGRSSDFREHFLDFASREHTLKHVMGRDRIRNAEIPLGVTAGGQFDMPGGAKTVHHVEDVNGEKLPKDWYEVVKQNNVIEGYRPASHIEWQEGVMMGYSDTGSQELPMMPNQPQVTPGGVYQFYPPDGLSGVKSVITNGGNILPGHLWSLIEDAISFWALDTLDVGTPQDIAIEGALAVSYVNDAEGRRLDGSQYSVDINANTFTVLDGTLPSGNDTTHTQATQTPGLNDFGRQDFLSLTLDDHTDGRVKSLDEVREPGTGTDADGNPTATVFDSKRIKRADGSANILIYDAITLLTGEAVYIDYTDTDGTAHNRVELPSGEGWQSLPNPIQSLETVYVGTSAASAEEIATGPMVINGSQVWLPTSIGAGGIHNDTARSIQADYTVDHTGQPVATPLTVAVNVDTQDRFAYLELSPTIDTSVYDLSYCNVIYSYDVNYEEPLTAVFFPEDAEEDSVLGRTLFSAYLATVKDVDDEDLFGQEARVGEYVREANDDGTLPVGNLVFQDGGDPIEGGVDYASGEITWRPTKQYRYSRSKDKLREEFGRIVQTTPYKG